MVTQYLLVNWPLYLSLTHRLAHRIRTDHTDLDLIVAISRGGLTLGHILTDYLRLPISTIALRSYANFQQGSTIEFLEKLKVPIKQKKVLVVDDVADTGKTFQTTKAYLKRLAPRAIVTAALYYKPHSAFKPDYIERQTSKWIVFPSEQIESILLITETMRKQNKPIKEIDTTLIRLGFTKENLSFARRHYH